MDKNAQRIAIAEACGWTSKDIPDEWDNGGPSGILAWRSPKGEYTALPDYLNDLNAMHEAEKILKDEQYNPVDIFVAAHEDVSFTGWLYRIMVRRAEEPNFRIHSATAAQRAEAFLRTLKLLEDT